MQTRHAGRLGRDVSVIGLGAWQLGGDWGDVGDDDARAVLDAAVDAGVTFVDTADVYGDGRSERAVGAAVRDHPDAGVFVATKMGRRVEQDPANYTAAAFAAWLSRSRENLRVEQVPLVQLHCPPDAVFASDEVFDALDELVAGGGLGAYGVSVETCEQALTAIARPRVASVQIIVNCFRQKPLEQVLPAAAEAGVAIVARVPLASGLLSGRYGPTTTFAPSDHRTYNRNGEAFDVGETFSGVPYEVGLEAVEQLRHVAGPDVPLARFALRWVVDQPGVTVVIPGARDAAQVGGNAAVGSMEPLTGDQLAGVRDVYDRLVREHVHDRW